MARCLHPSRVPTATPSAPSAGSVTPHACLDAAYSAGPSRCGRSVNVAQVCRTLDRDEQTVRLAATTVWEALRGICDREYRHAK